MDRSMASPPIARRPLSVIEAAQRSVELTRARLFPFRLERWLPLGFVTFLDRCGRQGGGSGGNFNVPGGSGNTDAAGIEPPDVSQARDWIGEHLVMIVGIGAILLVLIVAIAAFVLWINSRGVFMYADNVASGRFDVVRPWHEHRERAWSYFGWSFGLAMLGLVGALALLVPIAFSIVTLVSSGPSFPAIATIVGVGLLLIGFAIAMSLVSLLLRDFAAPLQIALGVPCGTALGVAWGLARANLGTFVVYVLLKIVFVIAAAILTFVTGCLTCCLGFLPVIHHTLLQPIYYFERGWSLALLDQAGYDVFPAIPPPAPVVAS
jgi:hypothetical protein